MPIKYRKYLSFFIAIFVCLTLSAEEWVINPDSVYNIEFSPGGYRQVELQIPLKAVKETTSLTLENIKGIIYPPAVPLGPAVNILPEIALENIATLTLPFEDSQIPLDQVTINVWYRATLDSDPVVLQGEDFRVDLDNKTVQIEIKETGTYQVGTWQSLGSNWPPASFRLQSPAASSSFELSKSTDTITFSWQKAVDPNSDEVHYNLLFASDPQLRNVIGQLNCGVENFIILSATTLRTLLKNHFYTPIYWGVEATDKKDSSLSLQSFAITIEDLGSREVPNLIFDYGSEWMYNDEKNLDKKPWKFNDYKTDNHWKPGKGLFGFGEWNNESPTTKLSSSRTTYYFRKSIHLDEIPDFLTARVKYDDGFVFYVNGVAAKIENIKSNPDYDDFAKGKSQSLVNFFINKDFLRVGENTLCVEMHQADFFSSDLAFDARLEKGQNAVSITWGPWLTLPINNSVTVLWETNERTSSELHYGFSKNLGSVVKGEASGNIHKLVATNLVPGQTYYYKIVSGNVHSAVKTFVAPLGENDNVRIGMYGDSRTFHYFHQVVVEAIGKHKPNFIVSSGDIVEKGTTLHEWYEQFLSATVNTINEIPFVSCRGNHDGPANGNIAKFVPLPENTPSPEDLYYYNFRYGPIIIMVIDSETKYAKGSKQYEIIKKDLEKYHKSNWILAVFHRAAYSSGVGHGGEENPKLAEEIVPLLERYGVDLVLSGHDHFYERSVKENVQYILSGGGGAPSTFGGYHLNPYSVTYDNFVLCYNILDVTPYTYKMEALTPEGKRLDYLEIDGRIPQIAVLQPEDALEKIVNNKYRLDENSEPFIAHKNQNFRIYFRAKDLDSDAQVSLYLDTDNKGEDGILIAENISEDNHFYYDWNVSSELSAQQYYIYAVIDDGQTRIVDYSHFRITVK